jgi:hypothetical protein
MELVLHTSPKADPSGDGMLAGWKVMWGLNPLVNNTAQPSLRGNFTYDGAGSLEGLTGRRVEAFGFDPEGNIGKDALTQ